MREADIECKVAHSPFYSCRTAVANEAIPFQSARGRKLAAESSKSATSRTSKTHTLTLKYDGQKLK
jgi:hypothetical protein